MKKKHINYKQSIILLISIFIGGILGFIFEEDIQIIKPFGDLFINLLLIIIVPLLFVSISSSITKTKKSNRIRKILFSTFLVFFITSFLCASITFFSIKNIDLVSADNETAIKELLDYELIDEEVEIDLLESTVDLISTNDFINLFTTDNMVALVLFSILFGLSINSSGEKGNNVSLLLDSLNEVIIHYIKIIMCYAPIGLGSYFAVLIGTFGSSLAVGFLKTFIIYLIISIFIYFGLYTLYAFIAGGKKAVVSYWKNVFPATIIALATCSSAASVPSNILITSKMGVSKEIAETTVSLGTSFHKEGSVVASVFKIMFLICLFSDSITGFSNTIEILFIALIVTLTVSVIPVGGGTISEALIIGMLGYPIAALPLLTILATVIDAPATVLNVNGNSVIAMLINRLVDGREWLKNKED